MSHTIKATGINDAVHRERGCVGRWRRSARPRACDVFLFRRCSAGPPSVRSLVQCVVRNHTATYRLMPSRHLERRRSCILSLFLISHNDTASLGAGMVEAAPVDAKSFETCLVQAIWLEKCMRVRCVVRQTVTLQVAFRLCAFTAVCNRPTS